MSLSLPSGLTAIGKRIALLLLIPVAQVYPGDHYKENVAPGADIMMMDFRWPWSNAGIYCANFSLDIRAQEKGGGSLYMYGGVTGKVPVLADGMPDLASPLQDEWRGSGPWSFWGKGPTGETPKGIEGAWRTYLDFVTMGHEGSSLTIGGAYPWVRRGVWYTQFARIWNDPADPGHSYLARWMRDHDKGEWHLLGVVRLPFSAGGFSDGNSGFIEHASGGAPRQSGIDRRLGYYRKDGRWGSSDTLIFPGAAGWAAKAFSEGDHEYLSVEVASRGAWRPVKLPASAALSEKREYRMKVNQPSEPTLPAATIAAAEAIADGENVAVSWEIPATATPQLGWRIEVYDNPECSGRPVAVREERMPQTRVALVPAAVKTPGVLVRIVDIADRVSAPGKAAIRAAALAAAGKETALRPGLSYEIFAMKADAGSAVRVADIGTGRRIATGTCGGIDLSFVDGRQGAFGLRYAGFVHAPVSGLYAFHLLASDAAVLKIDGAPVVSWDEQHGTMVRSGIVRLEKGAHAFSLENRTVGSPYLKLEWEGPGFSRSEIQDTAYAHRALPGEPSATIAVVDGKVRVEVKPADAGIRGVDLFAGRLRLPVKMTGNTADYDGPLFTGENKLFARIVREDGSTTDSPTVRIAGPVETLPKGWTLTALTDAGAPHGIRETAPGTVSALVEGEFFLNKKIPGDFTLTCRVDEATDIGAYGVSSKAWTGLMIGDKRFGLYRTAAFGVRTSADFNDFGTSGLGSVKLPDDPWLRIVRRGDVWTAWTSTDGRVWRFGARHAIPMAKTVPVGVLFRDTTYQASHRFAMRISGLELVGGASREALALVATPAGGTASLKYTGVVSTPADPAMLALRGPVIGILRSVDEGKTWKTANGGLAGAANAVRSVAFDPKNPSVMYRAAGNPARRDEKSGLWKTTDAGATWTKLGFPGVFDGTGPSAICGEILAVDPANTGVVFAGTENDGLYLSRDAGSTWERIAATGERITSVYVVTKPEGGPPTVLATTCPDRFMPMLGRGTPSLKTAGSASRAYLVTLGESLQAKVEITDHRPDVGIFKGLYFGKNRYFGTTEGFENTYLNSTSTLLSTFSGSESYRPVTAIAHWVLKSNSPGKFRFGPLSPLHPGVMSDNTANTRVWSARPDSPGLPKGGFVSMAGRPRQEDVTWVLATDGLYLFEGKSGFHRLPAP